MRAALFEFKDSQTSIEQDEEDALRGDRPILSLENPCYRARRSRRGPQTRGQWGLVPDERNLRREASVLHFDADPMGDSPRARRGRDHGGHNDLHEFNLDGHWQS